MLQFKGNICPFYIFLSQFYRHTFGAHIHIYIVLYVVFPSVAMLWGFRTKNTVPHKQGCFNSVAKSCVWDGQVHIPTFSRI